MKKKDKMVVIGYGRMGKVALKVFSKGFDIAVISSQRLLNQPPKSAANDPNSLLSAADYIFLAIPVYILPKWLNV